MSKHADENNFSELDMVSVDRFIGKIRRRETFRLALMTFFLINAVGAALFSAWVWWGHDLTPGFLGPGLIVEGVSLGLLAMMWRRSNRLRRMGTTSGASTRRFLDDVLEETRRAIREHRLLLVLVTAVLTPLFAIAVWQIAGTGKMAPRDVTSIAALYAVGLATVVGVTWSRLKSQLEPRERYLRRSLAGYGD